MYKSFSVEWTAWLLGESSPKVVFFRYVQINPLRVKKRYLSIKLYNTECTHFKKEEIYEDKYFTISYKPNAMTSLAWSVEIRHSQECGCTRVVHPITFKLTDFVWELSTVLHVELDLNETATTSQRSCKFLSMWKKKRTNSAWSMALYPWRPYLEILNVIGLQMQMNRGGGEGCLKKPRSTILYIEFNTGLYQDFRSPWTVLLLNGFQIF